MGLFKRMVIALEKIADKKPIDASQMEVILTKVFINMSQYEEAEKIKKMQRRYCDLKLKEKSNEELTDDEKKQIVIGDQMVKYGILFPCLEKIV